MVWWSLCVSVVKEPLSQCCGGAFVPVLWIEWSLCVSIVNGAFLPLISWPDKWRDLVHADHWLTFCSVSLPVVLHLLPSVPLELQWSGWRQNVSTNWLFECNLWIDVCWHPSVRQTPDSKTQHGPKARVGFELLFDTLSRCTCWHPSARWTQDSKHTVV